MAKNEEVDLFNSDMLDKFLISKEEVEEDVPEIIEEAEEEIEEAEEIEEDEETEEGSQEETVLEEEAEEEKEEDSPLLNFARLLKENGVLPDADFKSLKSTEDLIELVSGQIKIENEKYRAALPDPHREIAALLENGFTREEVANYTKNKNVLNSVAEEDLIDNVELQKNVYATWLKSQNYSDKNIAKLIDASEEDLLTEASAALDSLKEKLQDEIDEKAKQIKADKATAEKVDQEALSKLKSQVEETEEIIPGRKIPLKQRQKLYEMITKPVKSDDGFVGNAVQIERHKDPLKFEIVLAYLVSQGVFGGKWDSVMRTAKTQVTKNFEDSLYSSFKKIGGAGAQTQRMSEEQQTKALVDSLRNKL